MNESEFQLTVMKRAPLLDALSERPMTMGQLEEDLSTSRSTIHRALGTFQDLDLVRKTDQRYALTGFGRTVAERTSEFASDLGTAWELDEFLNAVDSDVDVPTEHFRTAEVIRPEPHKADRGVKRIIDLIEATESLTMFSNVLSPLYADVARKEVLDGMELEVIFDEHIVDLLVSEHAEDAAEAFRTGRFEVHIGSDVPFELFLYDDKMAMAAHDHSALPRVFVETDSDAAVDWARELYWSYKEQSQQFDPGTLAPAVETEASHAVDH